MNPQVLDCSADRGRRMVSGEYIRSSHVGIARQRVRHSGLVHLTQHGLMSFGRIFYVATDCADDAAADCESRNEPSVR
jgi:hypothetical protein